MAGTKGNLRSTSYAKYGSTMNTGAKSMTTTAKEGSDWNSKNMRKEHVATNAAKGPLGGKHSGS